MPDNRPCPICGEPVEFHSSPEGRRYGERTCFSSSVYVVDLIEMKEQELKKHKAETQPTLIEKENFLLREEIQSYGQESLAANTIVLLAIYDRLGKQIELLNHIGRNL